MRGIAKPKATQRRIRRRWWWLVGIMAFMFLGIAWPVPEPTPEDRVRIERERAEREARQVEEKQEQERAAAAQKAARSIFAGKLRGMPLVGDARWSKRGDLYIYTTGHGSKEDWRKLVLTVCHVAAARGIRDFNVLVLDYEFARLGEFKSRASKLCG